MHERGAAARYVETGHLVYFVDGTLMAVPFDAGELAVTGSAVPIADVSTDGFSMLNAQFSVSESGSLIHRPAAEDGTNRTLVWVDRNGREEEIAAEPRAYYRLSLSPDQRRSESPRGGARPGAELVRRAEAPRPHG